MSAFSPKHRKKKRLEETKQWGLHTILQFKKIK